MKRINRERVGGHMGRLEKAPNLKRQRRVAKQLRDVENRNPKERKKRSQKHHGGGPNGGTKNVLAVEVRGVSENGPN